MDTVLKFWSGFFKKKVSNNKGSLSIVLMNLNRSNASKIRNFLNKTLLDHEVNCRIMNDIGDAIIQFFDI